MSLLLRVGDPQHSGSAWSYLVKWTAATHRGEVTVFMRGAVLLGLLMRLLITRDAYDHVAITGWEIGILLFSLHTFHLLRVTNFGRHLMLPSQVWWAVALDTLFFSYFYAHTARAYSDLYLFFFLPLLIAAERFDIYRLLGSFVFISLAFLASFMWLGMRTAGPDALPLWRMLIQNALPRWAFFFFVLFLAFMRVRLLKEGEAQLLQKTEQADLIRQVALSIGSGDAMRDRLREALGGARNLLKCSGAVIYIARSLTLELVSQVGLPGGDEQLAILQIDESLAGETMRRSATIIVNDYQASPYRVKRLEGVTAALSVPLRGRRGMKALGVLCVFDTTGERRFAGGDALLLEDLAQHVALAVRDQVQLDDATTRAKALEVVFNCSQALIQAQMQIDRVLACVVHHASELIKVFRHALPTHAYVAIADDRSQHLSFEAGFPQDTLKLLNEKLAGVSLTGKRIGIIGRAFQTECVQISGDVQADPDYISIDSSIRSQIAVPLRTRNRMIGVVSIEEAAPNAFDDESAFYLNLLANASATAIENVRLIAAIGDQQRRSEDLVRAYEAIVAPHEVILLGEAVLRSLATLVPYERATLFLIRHDTTRIVEQSHSPLAEKAGSQEMRVPVTLALTYGDVTLGHIDIDGDDRLRSVTDDPVVAAFLQTATTVLQVSLLHEEQEAHLRELEATKIHLETLLENLQEYNNLALIGIVYGEDFHFANDRLGAARAVLSKLMHETNDAYVLMKIDETQSYLREYLETLEKTRDATVTKPEMDVVNIHHVLDNVITAKLRTNIDVRRDYQVPEGGEILRAPHSQLRQVFMVIVQNAIDAIGPSRGFLAVTTKPAGTSAVFVEISNTGSAIPPEKLQKIFEGLTRRLDGGPARKRGTGMGLFWARNFMRIFGGNIRIDSSDRRTTVTIQVPTDFTLRMPFLRKREQLNGFPTRSTDAIS